MKNSNGASLASLFGPRPGKPVCDILSLQDIYEAFVSKDIIEYGNNRGGQSINMTSVKQMLEDFDEISLGLLQVAVVNDVLVLCDFHHRKKLIELAFEDGKVKNPKETQIPIKVYHEVDFIRIYSRTNKNRGHSLAEKTRNVDLPLGAYLHKLASDVDLELGAAGYSNLADIAVAYHNRKTKMVLADVFEARNQTRNLANQLEGQITNLEQDSTKMLSAALKYYRNFQDGIRKFENRGRVDSKTLLKTPGLFMFVLKDCLTDRKFTNNDPNFVAFCAMSNTNKVIEESQGVARRNMKYVNEARLADYLNGNFERGSKTKLLKEFKALTK